MDLNDITDCTGIQELTDEAEIDAAFTARDAIAQLSVEGRIRVLSWIVEGLDIPVTLAAGGAAARE